MAPVVFASDLEWISFKRRRLTYFLYTKLVNNNLLKNNYNIILCEEKVKMEDTKLPRVEECKYLGSTVQESGGCEREVKKRVQAGWNGWRRVLGVICDSARVKGKVYSSVVKPTMVYGLETVAVTKKQMEEMEVAEMKMLRFAMGVTR